MIEPFARADLLPDSWDVLAADNYALKRDFLATLESGKSADQRYYLFPTKDGAADSILVAGAVRGFNILQFTPFTFRVNATLVHAPLSVTRPGFVFGEETRPKVESLLQSWKGWTIVLNAPPSLSLPGFAAGRTCSRIRLGLKWRNLPDYMAALRSPYRRRYHRILAKGAGLRYRLLGDNRNFDETLYSFYLAVRRKSRIGIEELGIDFFRTPLSKILVCEQAGRPVGFIQMIENGNELVFALAGLDYSRNEAHAVYFNLLLKMLEYALARGFRVLELGQTAEDAKLRLGGKFSELHVLIRHSNPLVNRLLPRFLPVISYRQPALSRRVFKEDDPP